MVITNSIQADPDGSTKQELNCQQKCIAPSLPPLSYILLNIITTASIIDMFLV
jgi:hypothetical protein